MSSTGELWKSITEGNATLAEEAIGKGAKIHIRKQGRSFLVWAVQEGHIEIVKLLIQAGADVNKKNPDGFTPLQQAVGEGNLEVVQYLLESGADINQPTVNCTPLHTAAAYGRTEIVKLLLEYGANKRTKDEKGRNARYFASYYGYSDLAEILKVRKGNNAT